ncbi:hypothetical protein [Kamptonema formosum]|uniref:hypothetical protein n=1 Tax=Kamptonema formosum TaxID=331992 RepID=UPI00037E4E43|nr:hypothetical protein [Oscillatoria sp. PCC 10802]
MAVEPAKMDLIYNDTKFPAGSMPAPAPNPWLAVLLALHNLETPLAPEERYALKQAGQKLALYPEDSQEFAAELTAQLAGNAGFSQLYAKALAGLEALDGPISPDWLPAETEIKQALPPREEISKRPWFEGKPEWESDEILNMTINVLATPAPEDTAKKLSLLEKLWHFLNQPVI